MEDPNKLTASVQEAALMLSSTSEFHDWRCYVRLYADRGLPMKEAVAMADTYIESQRKRTAEPLT